MTQSKKLQRHCALVLVSLMCLFANGCNDQDEKGRPALDHALALNDGLNLGPDIIADLKVTYSHFNKGETEAASVPVVFFKIEGATAKQSESKDEGTLSLAEDFTLEVTEKGNLRTLKGLCTPFLLSPEKDNIIVSQGSPERLGSICSDPSGKISDFSDQSSQDSLVGLNAFLLFMGQHNLTADMEWVIAQKENGSPSKHSGLALWGPYFGQPILRSVPYQQRIASPRYNQWAQPAENPWLMPQRNNVSPYRQQNFRGPFVINGGWGLPQLGQYRELKSPAASPNWGVGGVWGQPRRVAQVPNNEFQDRSPERSPPRIAQQYRGFESNEALRDWNNNNGGLWGQPRGGFAFGGRASPQPFGAGGFKEQDAVQQFAQGFDFRGGVSPFGVPSPQRKSPQPTHILDQRGITLERLGIPGGVELARGSFGKVYSMPSDSTRVIKLLTNPKGAEIDLELKAQTMFPDREDRLMQGEVMAQQTQAGRVQFAAIKLPKARPFAATDDLKTYSRRISEALGIMHQKGYSHADVFGNVMMGAKGATLTDFGVMEHFNEPGNRAGKLHAMSPDYLSYQNQPGRMPQRVKIDNDYYTLGMEVLDKALEKAGKPGVLQQYLKMSVVQGLSGDRFARAKAFASHMTSPQGFFANGQNVEGISPEVLADIKRLVLNKGAHLPPTYNVRVANDPWSGAVGVLDGFL